MVANPDFTFTQCSAAVWSLLEMNLGILCNALAALKPFVRQHMPNLFSSNGWGSGGAAGAGKPSGGSSSYPSKRSRSRAWGHTYQLHSVGTGKGEERNVAGAGVKDDIVVDHQFTVEYDNNTRAKAHTMTTGSGSTDSILAPQYPAHQPV
jgi:hypothetical protein